jgi:hypothetical protein
MAIEDVTKSRAIEQTIKREAPVRREPQKVEQEEKPKEEKVEKNADKSERLDVEA